MKILYVGNVQGLSNVEKYYLTEQRLINGFTRLGHNVCLFNDRDHARYANIFKSQKCGLKKMNEKLIESCTHYKPDLIVLSHCKNVSNETFLTIKNLLPNVKITYTNVDPVTVEQNINDIKQRKGIADTIFVTTAGEALKQFKDDNSRTYFFPNPVDAALDTQHVFTNMKADIDLLFLGSALKHQQDHRHELAKFIIDNVDEDFNYHIGGLGINDKKAYGQAYYDLLDRSKMGVSVSKTSNQYLYASDRMSHYMAAGILTFIPEGSQFEDILGDDAFVSFSDNQDLLEKITYFKNNDEERQRIAQTGYEKIHALFNVDKVCKYILETTFKEPYSIDYGWPVTGY